MIRRSKLAVMLACLVGGPGAAVAAAERTAGFDPTKPLERIALGSCVKQDRPQPIREAGARGVVVVSGDRHSAEISRIAAGQGSPRRFLKSPGATVGGEDAAAPAVPRFGQGFDYRRTRGTP